MQNANTALGRYGEEVAARRLAEDGLRVLERNWRCPEGELDIILLDDDTIAVCEVKTRSEHSFQQPEEALGPAKVDRLRRLAERWLVERWPEHFARFAWALPPTSATSAPPATPSPAAGTTAQPIVPVLPVGEVPLPPGGVRIDLVSVVSRARGAARIEHLRGVV
ncbi:YraN family protein [Kitasatospora sp. GAS204B]|uniref:YraN family protein n=1 Tax=unclassified Kitasatospora TaxID=2633591 RepID=UPI002476E8C3|nr:YraN family protein [Kitasatospora sp. GAS204B]MDH6122116.1 putative endonuclease [Kitasatospora sp. GAS204B]